MIEKIFGAELRDFAIRISRERYEVRREATKHGFQNETSCVSDRTR